MKSTIDWGEVFRFLFWLFVCGLSLFGFILVLKDPTDREKFWGIFLLATFFYSGLKLDKVGRTDQ